MNNFEQKLNNIKTPKLGSEAKDELWHNILLQKTEYEKKNENNLLSVNIFNLSMKQIIVGALALVLVLGGGGMVAASNDAVPGDVLFPIDLAIEKLQIRLAGEDKQNELRLRFAEERVSEIKKVSTEKTVPVTLVTDLSKATVTEIEADVFTNETVVKIEAGSKKYGYLSALKVKAELVKEISTKYSIAESEVEKLLDFEIENRPSRADDKGFLNKTHSVVFDDDEEDDLGKALTDLEELLGDDDSEKAEEIREALKELLILLGDENEIEIRKDGNKIKIEGENGEIKIKFEDKEKSEKDDDSSRSDDEDDSKNRDESKSKSEDEEEDVKEDDSEVFCRGEWRDAEDCKDDDSDDDDSDDDDDEEDEDDDKEDEDNSGRGGGDDKDDDN